MENFGMKNNLFYYATSELSQDAFLCYLLSFALEDAREDAVLRTCANGFLTAMLPETAGKHVVLTAVEKKQIHAMDVLLTAVCDGQTYKIVVEDKTHTREHDNQLSRYLERLRELYPDCLPRGVYYKTGFQSDLSAVLAAGYQIISRTRMLSLLAPFAAQTENQIVRDYFDYWNAFEQEAQAFRTVPMSQWSWRQVYAFYDAIQNSDFPKEKQVGVKYGYTATPSGGYEELCIWPYDDIVYVRGVRCELYLQVEASWRGGRFRFPLCLKLAPREGDPKTVRNNLIFDEHWNYTLTGYHFRRPGRLAVGGHMTTGIYDAEYDTAEQFRNALSAAVDDCVRLSETLKKTPDPVTQSTACYKTAAENSSL